MRKPFVGLMALIILSSQANAGEIAKLNKPLKDSYKLSGLGYKEFYRTGSFADSYSMVCDMGKAIPDPKQEDWYTNQPIKGLKLELRARAVIKGVSNEIKPMGFVVVSKNDDILITFKPVGNIENGVWHGDVFNSWSGTGTDIEVYSERFGAKGFAYFDLMDGNGFFYKKGRGSSPNYFLSDCKRIRKEKLPVYDWR